MLKQGQNAPHAPWGPDPKTHAEFACTASDRNILLKKFVILDFYLFGPVLVHMVLP